MRGRLLLVTLLGTLVAGCARPVDLKQALQVSDLTTGWFDAGIVEGKNKLVPSLTFRLRKAPGVEIPALSLNIVFKAAGDTEDWDDVFVQRVDFSDGSQTAPLVVRPGKGYTGDPPQSRSDMLKNTQFRDLNAKIFAKQSSTQWIELQQVKIERLILTQ
jgi:hypothetical protein